MSGELSADLVAWPSLNKIVESTIHAWPQHEAFLVRHFSERGPSAFQSMEAFARRLLIILGSDLDEVVQDYRWTCGKMLAAEYHYRRHGKNPNASFHDVVSSVYADPGEMRRYMRGLMLSQVLWPQHAGALLFFVERFLPKLPPSFDYLEVGPGHGLWMAMAAEADAGIRLTGLDISAESLAQTRKSLDRMGVRNQLSLEICDVCEDNLPETTFDAVVASQVLEIVSSPEKALANLTAALKPSGLLFLNVPVRASAPDHVRRWENTQEVLSALGAAGLTVREMAEIGGRQGEIKSTEGFSLEIIAARSTDG